MNKDSLINKIHVKSPFNKGKSARVFNRITELIKNSIIESKSFKIENFGEFMIERRELKNIIDLEKKAEILLPPKDKVVFKPAENLIKSINNADD